MQKLLLEANHITKTYGEQTVLDIDRLRIYDGERVGLIGENGAGKSTLLALLAGELAPDAGDVRRYCPASLIRQSGETRLDANAHMAAEFRAPEAREGLSGGEQTRRRIAGALSEDAPLLLADEPTTDLDAAGIERLRQRLAAHDGALVLVSHDRSLLNALCNRILHLEDGHLADFPGSYADYQAELARRRSRQQFEYDQYRAERSRLKAMAQQKAEWAASVRKAPKRMGNSEARLHTHEYTNAVLHQSAAKRIVQNRMDRLEVKERPRDLPDIRMTLGVAHPIAAKVALTLRCRQLRAGDRTLLGNAALELPTGSRTALMGENGCGKTTLLRALRGEPSPGTRLVGDVRLNPAARPAWFDQDHARTLRFDATALENALSDSALPESAARTVLARLNLRGDSVFKPVRVLSGGERAKVALARLLLSDANLLLLDEPTNHLDVFTMEALEQLLCGYGGTVLFVSHDRAFVSAAATRIVTLSDRRLQTFEGTLAQQEAEAARDRRAEDAKLAATALEMRMAALAGRMAAPRKGDRPEQLSAEYDALARQLRDLKRSQIKQ
ncbi:MAG: ATP-binding cassette domain-containing protein [Clostridia bacterium]|nr:ATP-binding cassette domain-containing protein [Clostridia bacterium]